MGNSLQDQLRALGLARKTGRKGDKAATEARIRNAGGGSEPEATAADLSLGKAWALREQAERREAERRRQRKREDERRRREINQAIRAIVDSERQNRDDAEVARNFLYRGRIRKVYVNTEQQQALAEGRLGIIYLAGGYHLLAEEHVEAVRAISPEHVVDLLGEQDDVTDDPVRE